MNLMKNLPNRLKGYGELWSSWHIGEEIGEGFGSKVYILTSKDKQIRVLKTISTAFGADDADRQEKIEQIIQQIDVLKDCPGVNRIEEYAVNPVKDYTGQTAGYDILLRMKRMYSLQRVMDEEVYLDEAEVIELALELAYILKDAHSKNIIHGNIKPSNIFIEKGSNNMPVYYLGDFASDKIRGYREGNFVGATYCSPESASFGVEEEKSDDFYSLGLVIYQLLNRNEIPFIDETEFDLGAAVKKRMMGTPLPELNGIQSDIDEVLMCCCSYKKEYRYHSADEIISDLKECQKQLGKRQNPKYSIKLERTQEQKRAFKKICMKYGAGAAAVVAAGALISVGISKWNSRPVSVIRPELTSLAVVSSENIVSSEVPSTPAALESVPSSTPSQAESSTPVIPAKTKEEVIQMMLASEGTWCQGNFTTPEGIPLANNEIGFVDFDQDGTPEFIHGYAVEPLVGVPVGYWKRYDVFSIKTGQLEFIGSLKTLDAKQNVQTGQIVFYNHGYIEGKNINNIFTSCLEGEAASFVNGKIETTKLFEKKTQREVTAPQETAQYFIYENGQPREVTMQEYDTAVNQYHALLQPASIAISYMDWDPNWAPETKVTALTQIYDPVIPQQ